MNVDQVVAGPFGQVDTIQIFQSKIMFRSVLVDDDPFTDQSSSRPLGKFS